MRSPNHLSVVPQVDINERLSEPVIERPKFLREISDDATLREVFVYCQCDFAAGAAAYEMSRRYDPQNPAIPEYSDRTLVALGGEFTKADIVRAIHAQQQNEDPKITQLREVILDAMEREKLFETTVRRPEDAHRYGLVSQNYYSDSDVLFENGIPLGVMAYEH